MNKKIYFQIQEVITKYNIEHSFLLMCINNEWLDISNEATPILDEEDISRVLLIHDLKETMGVNDESIPIILDLIDQLNCLQNKILTLSTNTK
ncbi:MAG: chaperone modulator CbpM [Candidatus Riflemargulisbacteria bacterium]